MSYTMENEPGAEHSFGVTKPAPETADDPTTDDDMDLLNSLLPPTEDKTLRKRAFTTLLRAIGSGRGV